MMYLNEKSCKEIKSQFSYFTKNFIGLSKSYQLIKGKRNDGKGENADKMKFFFKKGEHRIANALSKS